MTNRKKPKPDTQAEVLVLSGRRCCLCHGLENDFFVKRGQIAHLDHDPSNSQIRNLAYLCFEHHDLYDSKTSQSKGFTIGELLLYRDVLYEAVRRQLQRPSPFVVTTPTQAAVKLHELLESIRACQVIRSDLLNGYELQKANEHGFLTIMPFDEERLSIVGYGLTVGDQAYARGRRFTLDAEHPLTIPPGEIAHIATREFIEMPSGLLGKLTSRASLSRLGLFLSSAGSVHPGFRGHLVLSFVNWVRVPVMAHYGLEIAAIEFSLINEVPAKP